MGRDKSRLVVAGDTLLDRLLHHIPDTVPVIVVGPPPGPTRRPVVVTREQPPGGGPVAGIAAGLGLVATPSVVVAAVDLPFAGPALAGVVDRLTIRDAAVPVLAGRRQPLAAAYRTDAIRAAVTRLGDPVGRSMRDVLTLLSIEEFEVGDQFVDIDTPAELAAARARVDRRGDIMGATEEGPMDKWVTAVAAELGVADDVDIDLVLDVAKEAAHKVQRPAAPVTTYLLGMAIANGKDPQQAAATIRELAAGWTERA